MAPHTALAVGVALALCSAPLAAAGDGPRHPAVCRTGAEPGAAEASPSLPQPWVSRAVMAPVRARLEAGIELALRRLEDRPQCRALFEGLAMDGLQALSSTYYYPTDLAHEEWY